MLSLWTLSRACQRFASWYSTRESTLFITFADAVTVLQSLRQRLRPRCAGHGRRRDQREEFASQNNEIPAVQHHCLLGLILQVRPGMGFWVQIPGISHPRRRWKPPATLPRTHRRPPSEHSCFPCLKLAGVKAEFPSKQPSPGSAHGLSSPPHHRWSTLQ